MILTCPQCTTRYLLPADTLAPEGRRVKCMNCNEVWFQLPDEEELYANQRHPLEDIPDSVKPIPEGSNLPALPGDDEEESVRPKRGQGYLAAAGVFVCILGVLLMFNKMVVKVWPASTVFYEALGYDIALPGEGLAIDQVKAAGVPGESGETLRVSGNIINLTKDLRDVTKLEAALHSQAGEILETWMIDMPDGALAGESTLPFSSTHQTDHKDAAQINVRFVMKTTKIAAADADNTQALPSDDQTLPNAPAEDAGSPEPSSSPLHSESSPASPGTSRSDLPPHHTDDPADHNASPSH
jgi:predicted Zn finger-like uncharacterized protein